MCFPDDNIKAPGEMQLLRRTGHRETVTGEIGILVNLSFGFLKRPRLMVDFVSPDRSVRSLRIQAVSLGCSSVPRRLWYGAEDGRYCMSSDGLSAPQLAR
jgi:hypothetical protein